MEKDLKNSVGIVQTRKIRVVEQDAPLTLKSGKTLGPIDVAYETYGQLSPEKDNAILICHALSGNAHVAGYNKPDDRKPGWWDAMVGPGKPIDTNVYFVICSNVLGGCSGTTGPSDINPATGIPYGLDFPIITIEDIVTVQKLMLEKLGVTHLLAVVGGSMGGMQVLQWAIAWPDWIDSAICIASTTRLNAQSIAFDAVGRNAILGDPNFNNGQYHKAEQGPARGLSIARMIGHITYLSEQSMREKFGRELRSAEHYQYDFNSEFSVETYLDYQGQTFVERFDANSYLYITKAMDYFDLNREYGTLRNAFNRVTCRFLVISFSSDWLFTPAQSEEIVEALCAEGKDVTYCNIYSPYGHDAFLLESASQDRLIAGFLESTLDRVRTGSRCLSEKHPSKQLKTIERSKRLRVDYELINKLITPDSRVLDLGCGDGELMARLIQDKHITAIGIELEEDLVVHTVERGLSVIHRDIERGLSQFPTDSFDYVILSQTLQTLRDPEKVFKELLRIGKKVVVSFPNFAHWACRMQMLLTGRAPQTRQLPFRWYNSPNIHFLSLKDFDDFCAEQNIYIEKKIPIGRSSAIAVRLLPNLLASQAIYITSKYQNGA